MKNLLNKAKVLSDLPDAKFEKFNLRENPFPAQPMINKENSDKRYNGDIYESEIRVNEFNKIETNFLKIAQSNPNHQRIAYILDTSYVGRGNGKTTFAINLLKNINKNYCLDISEGVNKCFGLYIMPAPGGKTKSFVSLLDLIFNSIVESKIIEYTIAALRLEAILKFIPDFTDSHMFQNEETLINQLNDEDWVANKNLNRHEIIEKIFELNPLLNRISSEFPIHRGRYALFQKSFLSKSEIVDYYKSLKNPSLKIELIFDDLVNLFLAGGFNGSYIFIDDFERIPDFQSDRQKRDFALEIRTCFYDGISTNAKLGFFNLILMLHAGVPALMQKAWGDTGMEQRSPINSISEQSNHVVFFDKLNKNHAKLLIQKYLSEYRIKEETNTLNPFTEEAITKIGEMNEYNAARILRDSYLLLEIAAKEGIESIDEDFVIKIKKEKEDLEEETTSKIEDLKSVNLLSKSGKK
jgi:hypothetical protein